jgi:hypothetical protein
MNDDTCCTVLLLLPICYTALLGRSAGKKRERLRADRIIRIRVEVYDGQGRWMRWMDGWIDG